MPQERRLGLKVAEEGHRQLRVLAPTENSPLSQADRAAQWARPARGSVPTPAAATWGLKRLQVMLPKLEGPGDWAPLGRGHPQLSALVPDPGPVPRGHWDRVPPARLPAAWDWTRWGPGPL